VQALTDFLRSNKIEVLNVAGPRESKEPGVYELTLTILRFLLIGRLLLGSTEAPSGLLRRRERAGEGKSGDPQRACR
jgi:hypothetical protein